MLKYKNKLVSIIGTGKTGISCIEFFTKNKSIISVFDTRYFPPNINLIPKNINKYFGNLNFNELYKSDLIIVSPGFNINLLNKNKIKNIEIISDIEVFFRENISSNVILITGTNGKSTVVSLIYNLLIKNNYKVFLGGNIGNPILYSLKKKYDYYIIELSSFQLENTFTLKCISSSCLNISNDHLDRHINIKKYINIKLKVYKNSDLCIINNDDLLSYPKNINLNSKYVFFGKNIGNYYLNFFKNDIILMNNNKFIINTNNLKIFGIHNYLNILASLAIIENIKTNININIDVLKKFNPLKHRLNIFLEFNNIKWINDSKSTNLNSLIIAINSFKIKNKMHLIIGGDIKKSNFCYLINLLNNKKIIFYCFGKDGFYIYNLLKKKPIYMYNLKNIILKIFSNISPNDIVLFSPGCSSLDQYTNYEDRGDFFVNYVNKIFNNIKVK